MNDWMALTLIGLGTMRVVEILKEIMPWPLQAWTKSGLSILVALIGTWLLADGQGWHRPSEWIVMGLGSAGLACVIHELVSVLALTSDNFKQQVILRYGTRRRIGT